MLERNTAGGEPPAWMSTHDSPGEASAAWAREDRREDREPVALVGPRQPVAIGRASLADGHVQGVLDEAVRMCAANCQPTIIRL